MGLLHYYTADGHEIAREGRAVGYRGLRVWVLKYCWTRVMGVREFPSHD